MKRWVICILVLSLFLAGCATVTGPPISKEEERLARVEILKRKIREYLACQQRVGDIMTRILEHIKDPSGKSYPYVGIKAVDLKRLDEDNREAFYQAEKVILPKKGYLLVYVPPYYRKQGLKTFDILDPQQKNVLPRVGKTFTLHFINGETMTLKPEVIKTTPVQFHIVDSMLVNAWVTPGNNLYVTTAMCRTLPDDDELAIVIGHELAHLKRGHLKKRMALSFIYGILGAIANSLGGRPAYEAYRAAASFAYMKFSRDQEREADFFGMMFAYKAGFNVEKVEDAWLRLATVLPGSTRKSYLSGHPLTYERLARMKKIVALLKQGETFQEIMKEEKRHQTRQKIPSHPSEKERASPSPSQ